MISDYLALIGLFLSLSLNAVNHKCQLVYIIGQRRGRMCVRGRGYRNRLPWKLRHSPDL